MKITSAQQTLAASHFEQEQRAINERLQSWTGHRSRRSANDSAVRPALADNSTPTRISDRARWLAANQPAPAARQSDSAAKSSAVAAPTDEIDKDPGLAVLRNMLEKVFGIHIKTFDAAELNVDSSSTSTLAATEQLAVSNGNGDSGLAYEYHALHTETESTRFSAAGIVKTEDGQTFEFKLSLEMTRSFSEQIDLSYRAGQAAQQKDPLVFNFAGPAGQLADQRFEIDLDGDGKAENARFAAKGSGFLVFDKNGDGKINSGKEMFGPSTGNGFGELAAHDSDQNGWIDENDPIYARLKVWTKLDDGTDLLKSLMDSNVGAISLANLATPFAIRDGQNTPLGQVRNTSVYLTNDGQAGTVQQVDLAV